MRFNHVVVTAAFFLAACGSSTGDRAASGAGIGATAGAVVGAVTGLSILQGVVIGGVAGGVVGVVTDESQIDLGDPIWADDEHTANSTAIGRVQAGLTQLGYDPGPIDGAMGSQTQSAIEAYQRDHGLLVDGRASAQLAQHIEDQLETASG
jgi:hypothetical protein